MNDHELAEALSQFGLDAGAALGPWGLSVRLLAAFDAIGRDGGIALIKVDGGRPDGRVYTVVVSGGRLGEATFHKDAADLQPLLREAVAFYLSHRGA